MLHKLPQHGIRNLANCWLSSYLFNRKQVETVSEFHSETQSFRCEGASGVCSVSTFFNIYQLSSYYHEVFTIFSLCRWYISTLNKDVKELSFWLNANKIALNVARTEIILLKTKHKPCNTDLRLKLCRKRLNKTKCVRYLGIKIDENLNWKIHVRDISSKLNRANAVLGKLRYFISNEILRSTYFAIYHSYLNYVCMPSLGTYKISSTKLVYSQRKINLFCYIPFLFELCMYA